MGLGSGAGVAAPRADALHCERVTRRHARTFSLASWFLPPAKRRAAFALYAFCRVADDTVDQGEGDAAAVGARLDGLRRRLDAALGGRPDDPLFRELGRAAERFGVPARVLHELVDGVARDLRPVRYERWPDLARYCEGVASTVAEMCTHVFGLAGGPEELPHALRYARTLGVAMQLTNILRDVGEDARRGRCYLPEDDLAAFGLARHEVLAGRPLGEDERWRALVAYQIGRARSLYEAALPGIALLAPDARRCAAACAVGYAAILGRIERNGFDNITRRASLGGLARSRVLLEVWRVAARPPAPRLDGAARPLPLPAAELAGLA